MKKIFPIFLFFIILFSCNSEHYNSYPAVEKIYVGPYILAGFEINVDISDLNNITDTLESFLQSKKVKTRSKFLIFREKIKKGEKIKNCMIGYIIQRGDRNKISELSDYKNILIQEMGITQSISCEFDNRGINSISGKATKVMKYFNSYSHKNQTEMCPVLCVFDDEKITFSMELKEL